MSLYRSVHKKRRSLAQKAQTISLAGKGAEAKRQRLKLPKVSVQEQLKRVQLDLKSSKAREKRAKMKNAHLEAKLQACSTDYQQQTSTLESSQLLLKNKLTELSDTHQDTTQLLEETQIQLNNANVKADRLSDRVQTLNHDRDALRKRRTRAAQAQLQDTQSSSTIPTSSQPLTLTLKDPTGTIQPEVRDLLRELAAEGVGTEHIMPVIRHVVAAFGFQVTDSVSPRSVARTVLEGFVQSQIQIAYEINKAKCISISGDGTSIKNLQHEAKLIRLPVGTSCTLPNRASGSSQPNPTPALRTLGVHKAASHTAEAQRDGWNKHIRPCFQLLNESPMGRGQHVDDRIFGAKVSGMVTDHAADQKRLAELIQKQKIEHDRGIRGESVLANLSNDEKEQVLSDYLEVECRRLEPWDTLSNQEKEQAKQSARSALCFSLGQDAYSKLTDEEKSVVDLFVWTGCCMHKEMNAVKGGVTAMSSKWDKLGLTPPIPLRNMYESAHQNRDTNKQTPKSQQEHSRGAVKLTSLAGAVFNHKDDKKGQKDTYKNWFEQKYGYRVSFPDTSNTRYGSHCAAAIELLIHRSSYLEFCEVVRDAKNSATFTNIEKNLYDGLRDPATLTELAVLALYALAIGFPYMIRVRSGVQNAVGLGVFHEQVKNRCRSIIENPDLLLDPSLPPGAGTLDGRPWGRPDVVYCILSMAEELPNLVQMLVTFFGGALEAWERFTLEYAPDGTIAQAGPELLSNIYNSATNDVSEGALGQCRQMLRHKPTITDNQRNGRVMWSHNNTHEFAQAHLTDDDQAFVRREARRIDQDGETERMNEEINNVLIERATVNREKRAKATEKRSANEKRLDGVQILKEASEAQIEKLTVRKLDEQIDKLRKTDTELPAKSKIGNKKAKAKAVWEALERLRAALKVAALDGGKEPMGDEFSPVKPTDRGIPQDEDMFYPDEVPICA